MTVNSTTKMYFQIEEYCNIPGIGIARNIIVFRKTTDKQAFNGLSYDMKSKTEIWYSRFEDTKHLIGFETFDELDTSDNVAVIQDALSNEVALSSQDKKWVNNLYRAVKQNAIRYEKIQI